MVQPHNPEEDVAVTDTITQSREDVEANHRFDEARDNELQDEVNVNN